MMKAFKSLGMSLMAALVSALCLAADPPAADTKPVNEFARSLEEAQKMSPDAALQKARDQRALADQGDAGATYQFGVLLMLFGRFGPMADTAHAKEWNELSGYRTANQWFIKAAELGDPQAVELACRLAADVLAPQFTRDEAQAGCRAGQSKLQPAAEKSAG